MWHFFGNKPLSLTNSAGCCCWVVSSKRRISGDTKNGLKHVLEVGWRKKRFKLELQKCMCDGFLRFFLHAAAFFSFLSLPSIESPHIFSSIIFRLLFTLLIPLHVSPPRAQAGGIHEQFFFRFFFASPRRFFSDQERIFLYVQNKEEWGKK